MKVIDAVPGDLLINGNILVLRLEGRQAIFLPTKRKHGDRVVTTFSVKNVENFTLDYQLIGRFPTL